jgi:hypothetical protein
MKSSVGRVNGQPHSGSRKDGALAFICFYLAGANMTDAGAMKRSTGVKILPQGGNAFLLEALGVKLSDRMSGIQAAGSASCMEPRKPETGRKGASFFLDQPQHAEQILSFFPHPIYAWAICIRSSGRTRRGHYGRVRGLRLCR